MKKTVSNNKMIISLFDKVFDFYLDKKITKREMKKRCSELWVKWGKFL